PEKIQLLADVKAVFDGQAEDYLSSEEIIAGLKALSERPWADWNKARGISPAQLAGRLRDFGNGQPLRTRKTRLATKTGQRWHRVDFTDAWTRYLTSDASPDLTSSPEQAEQSNVSGLQAAISNSEHHRSVPGSENADLSMFTDSVPGVPGSRPDLKGENENV